MGYYGAKLRQICQNGKFFRLKSKMTERTAFGRSPLLESDIFDKESYLLMSTFWPLMMYMPAGRFLTSSALPLRTIVMPLKSNTL